mmetsp:Transcript_24694/g.51216  ORF Transcript_24694/g.51216 Transcript_24694/m.51216 type:complete len:265 (-) Transcript_24694:90-884(-)
MALKSLLILAQLGLVASLAPGDCAFVGIYGDQDDFALVLMEDADGEVLSLTEEYPTNDHFKVSKSVVAKKHVSEAKRGTVLKKADFEADSASFVAPTALTVFTGSQEAPTPLCSINLEAKQGNVARKLSEEVSVVMLGLTETAQYAGSTSGSKEELLEDISNPSNWLRDASRKLAGFSIANGGGNMTETESTSMMLGNATVTVSTTVTTVVTMTDTATETTVVTVTATDEATTTDLGGGTEGPPDAACHSGLAFGVLMVMGHLM